MKSRETLKKLYFINSVFPEITGNDLYFADQIRRAVEGAAASRKSADDGPETGESFEDFREAVLRLREKLPASSEGFAHWDAGACPDGFSPLWARGELIGILKRLASEPQATLLVTNLAESVRPRGRRWTRRSRREYGEAIAFIRDLARRWSRPSARLKLIVY
jgi:hypothetical protein